MPPSEVSLGSSPSNNRLSRHPTARTIAFDGTSDLLGAHKPKAKSRSKYFAGTHGTAKSVGSRSRSASLRAMHSDDEGYGKILVPGSSSPVRSSPVRRPIVPLTTKSANRTNPFSTSKADSDKRKVLPSPKKDIVDLTDDTPERLRPPLADRQSKNTTAAAARKTTAPALTAKIAGKSGQGSMVDYLGLKDANGRPKKTIATGEKARRRA